MELSPDKKHLTRRTVVLGGLMLAPFPFFLGRLYYLQHLAGQRYRKMAEKNRIHLRPLRPWRGQLLDRYQQTIAQDVTAYRLVLIREQCPNPEAILKKLSHLVALSKKSRHRILDEIRRHTPFTPVTIMKKMPFADLAKVQVNLPDLPGLDLMPVAVRKYPQDEILGHLTGYVGLAPEKEKKLLEQNSWPPDFTLGRQGLERAYDTDLRGLPGIRQIEVNAHGREIREISKQDPLNGKNTVLSLDLALQEYAWKALGEYSGAVVVMDAANGALLTAASKPAYNPNQFVEGFDETAWSQLRDNPQNPLLNRALQGVYAPGSTFKMVVAIAALEEGLANADEVIRCRGHVRLGNRDFHCWKTHGPMDLYRAIAESCDIYFYELGKRLGVDKIAHYARIFGLDATFGLGIPEKRGLVPTQAWKKKRYNESWNKGEDLITAIGQGFMLTTPLQLAVMTSRLATGRAVTPVLRYKDEPNGNSLPKLPIKQEVLAIIHRGMKEAVHTRHGTAYTKRPKGFTMSGKTGTAQVVSERFDDDVKLESIPKEKRAHGLFVGFAPAKFPRFAISVTMENAGSGGRFAAPVARDVLSKAMATS